MENESDKLEQAHKEHLGMFVSDFLVLLIFLKSEFLWSAHLASDLKPNFLEDIKHVEALYLYLRQTKTKQSKMLKYAQ